MKELDNLCMFCGQSMVTDEGNLYCVEHNKIVMEDETCEEFNQEESEYIMKISEAYFINQCLESNECTLEEFHDYFEIFPCDCEYENCEGWQTILKKDAVKRFYENSKNKIK